MLTFEQIILQLKEKKYKPIYFLMGEESYYIDKISSFIEKHVLSQEEKSFNQITFYSWEIDFLDIIAQAKRYPIMSPYRVIIIKEAQFLSKELHEKKIVDYIASALTSTLLVVCYKNKVLDKRQSLYKVIQKNGVLFESKKYRLSQIPSWIDDQVRSMKRYISLDAKHLFTQHFGNSLSKISHELEKIYLTYPEGTEITSEYVIKNIGIRNHFNFFSWQHAIAENQIHPAQEIAVFFGNNPQDYPIMLLINMMYRFFINLVTYHLHIPDTELHLAKILSISPFFLRDYEKAAHNYSLKKTKQIFSYLREADKQVKGIDVGTISASSILLELTYKICI